MNSPIAFSANPAEKLRFRAAAGNTRAGAVDVKSGRLSGVALLTCDREAEGWSLWIDPKTVALFAALLEGRRLKAYATHGSAGLDGTLDEVGYWEKPRIEGKTLRADFVALNAWRQHSPGEYAALFELAEKLPEEFGSSLSFSYTAAWILANGAELETRRRETVRGVEFDPPAPAGALRQYPSVRPTAVYSADFVEQPAANAGLFAAKAARQLDGLSGFARIRASFEAARSGSAKPAASPAPAPARPALQFEGLRGLDRVRAAFAASLKKNFLNIPPTNPTRKTK